MIYYILDIIYYILFILDIIYYIFNRSAHSAVPTWMLGCIEDWREDYEDWKDWEDRKDWMDRKDWVVLIFGENSLWKWSWRSLGAGIGSKRLPERYQRGWMVQKSAQGGEQRRP